MDVIDRASLNLGARLNKGGQGVVYPIVDDGSGADYVYKEYVSGVDVDYAVLDQFPGRFKMLPPRTRTRLAFPRKLVAVGTERLSGFVMPRIPERFFLPNGREKKLQNLLNGPEFAAKIGTPFSDRERFLLLADLATTLHELHDDGIAVGDISPMNVLYTFDPEPEAYLIDCDSMIVGGHRALDPAETPDWDAPGGTGPPDEADADDAYKFGLLVLRLLVGDQQVRDPDRLPAGTPAEIAALLRTSLSSRRRTRPRIEAWLAPLSRAADSASRTRHKAAAKRRPTAATRPVGQYGTPSHTGQMSSGQTSTGQGRAQSVPPVAGVAATAGMAGGYAVPVRPVTHYGQSGLVPGAAPVGDPNPSGGSSPWGSLLAILVVLGVVVAGVVLWTNRGGGSTEERSATEPSSSSVVTTEQQPSPITTYDPPTSESRVSATPPVPGGTPVDALSCGARTTWGVTKDGEDWIPSLNIGVGATTPATRCDFAENVAREYGKADSVNTTVVARSPSLQRDFTMYCSETSKEPYVLRCHDGANAEVYLYY